ncbi:MAG: MmcQ/YjbR family DNA-binding protein, partial [Oscillospiraceae bacterium]|nr:MmcQ/YjbR family DNA-binding protein [Oscillospiraceae bacterium]
PWIDEYLVAKKAVQKDYKAEWNWDIYMIEGKMFAAICYDDETQKAKFLTLKLEPSEGEFLRSQYEDIIAGYYMNKTHWNSVVMDGNVPNELVKEMLDKSYSLILASFSKKKQTELLK